MRRGKIKKKRFLGLPNFQLITFIFYCCKVAMWWSGATVFLEVPLIGLEWLAHSQYSHLFYWAHSLHSLVQIASQKSEDKAQALELSYQDINETFRQAIKMVMASIKDILVILKSLLGYPYVLYLPLFHYPHFQLCLVLFNLDLLLA